MGVVCQGHAPAALPPVEETSYALYRRLCGPRSRSGKDIKFSPPPTFELRNVESVTSRYTYYSIPVQYYYIYYYYYYYYCSSSSTGAAELLTAR